MRRCECLPKPVGRCHQSCHKASMKVRLSNKRIITLHVSTVDKTKPK